MHLPARFSVLPKGMKKPPSLLSATPSRGSGSVTALPTRSPVPASWARPAQV